MSKEKPIIEPREAYGFWLADAPGRQGAGRRLSPTEDLLAEHYLMNAVLLAMDAEARRLKGGEPIRAAFWSAVTDFNGNFVHLGHRVKEELHYIPALTERELIRSDSIDVLHDEHERAKRLTLNIASSVQQGDWEAALRFVVLYVHFLPHHMRQEEHNLFRIGAEELSSEVNGQLRAVFDEIDERTVAGGNRAHYVELVRQLCESTGVNYDLGSGSPVR